MAKVSEKHWTRILVILFIVALSVRFLFLWLFEVFDPGYLANNGSLIDGYLIPRLIVRPWKVDWSYGPLTYDLYWMAVDPQVQHAGVGTLLIGEMERRLAGHARLVIVETAGRPAYSATRAFYRARGYRPTARIPDFYAPDDDLVVFTKMLGNGPPAPAA